MRTLNQRDRALVADLLSEYNYFGESTDKYFERNREQFRRIILMPIEITETDYKIFKEIEEDLGFVNFQDDSVYGPIEILLVVKYILPEEEKERIQNMIYDSIFYDESEGDVIIESRQTLYECSLWCKDFILKNEEEGFSFDLQEYINKYIKEHPLKYKYKRKKTQTL